ncbi:MAG: hypothetical protein VX068_07405, partial [Candidatus Thermoplasmatota archaeon]|nr:hypothetical protein [Candidatus Thermoplasmatota archaeon]
GGRMTARSPKDDEEHFKALLALLHGRGRSIAEVIEELTGETPSEETVEAVKNRLQMAQESGEQVDIVVVVQSISDLAEQWA